MTKSLEAVVEILNIEDFEAWKVTKNLYTFIRLSKVTTFLETGSIVAEIAAYGNRKDTNKKPNDIISDLINEECLIVGGGLKVVDGEREIYPSCCCGLEGWDEWLLLKPENTQIWLGHDPSPYIEFKADNQVYRIWSDGGLGESNDQNFYIDFSAEEMRCALHQVSQDLRDFTFVLDSWAQEIAQNYAKDLVEKFKTNFHID